MQKSIENFIKVTENGLYLIDMPTGTGKTTQAIDYIFDHMDKNTTFFYVTSLNKNVDDAYNKLRYKFNASGKLNVFDDMVLRLYSNSEQVIEKLGTVPYNPDDEIMRFNSYIQLKREGNCYCVSEDDRPSFIGKIVINGKNIEVSPKLNTIIGSRGSGKSLFLDKIYMSLHNENDNIGFFKNKDRMNFIASQQMELYDMNNNLLNTNFYVDYYDQGYISKVFENKDSLINTDYFGSEMSKIPDFNIEMEKGKLIEALSFVKSNANKSTENIVSLIQRIPILNDNTKNYKNFKIIKSSVLEFIEYDDFLTKTRRIFPKSIIDEIEIDDLIEQFFYKVKERIHTKNIKKLLSDYFTYELESKYNNIINTLSQERKMKSQTLKSVKQYLISNTSKICDRVAFINNLLKLSIETKTIQNKNTSSKGFDNNEFIFEKK